MPVAVDSVATEERLFEPGSPPDGDHPLTLEDLVLGTFGELTVEGRASCPVCGGDLRPAAGCERCGSDLY